MRTLLIALLLLAQPAFAQQGPTVQYPPLLIQDESSDVARATRALNFIGSAVNCVNASGVISCTVTAGGGSGNFVDTTVAMTSGAGYYSATITGQAWVTASSVIICQPFGTTADGLTVEQVAAAQLDVTVSNRVVGTGFNINIVNPTGSYGTHRIHCTGA